MTYTSQVDMESKVLTLELNDSCEVDLSPPKWYSSIFGSSSLLKTDKKVAEFMEKFWPNTDFLYVFTKNPESKRLEGKFEMRALNPAYTLVDFLFQFQIEKVVERTENGCKITYKKKDGKLRDTYAVFKENMPHDDNTSRYSIKHPFTDAEIQLILTGDGPFKAGNKSQFSPDAELYFAKKA